MKKFTAAFVLLLTLVSFFALSEPVFAEDNGNGDSGNGEVGVEIDNHKFKFQSQHQRFKIHGIVSEVSESGNPATTVKIGPDGQAVILDPLAVEKYHQKGVPEVGGRAKVQGLIDNGDFFAWHAHFWPAVDGETDDEDGEENGEPENGDQEEPETLSVSVKIKDGEFEINAPIASASGEGLQVLDQNLVIDPGAVDSFEADIEGPPDAIAQAEIEGQIGSDGTLLIEKIKVRPTLFEVVGATILEVIDAIFSALSGFFALP